MKQEKNNQEEVIYCEECGAIITIQTYDKFNGFCRECYKEREGNFKRSFIIQNKKKYKCD